MAELAADPELRSGAETLMLDMLEPTLDLPKVQAEQRALWRHPHVDRRIRQLVRWLMRDPSAARIVRYRAGRIAADPTVKKLFVDFLDGW